MNRIEEAYAAGYRISEGSKEQLALSITSARKLGVRFLFMGSLGVALYMGDSSEEAACFGTGTLLSVANLEGRSVRAVAPRGLRCRLGWHSWEIVSVLRLSWSESLELRRCRRCPSTRSVPCDRTDQISGI